MVDVNEQTSTMYTFFLTHMRNNIRNLINKWGGGGVALDILSYKKRKMNVALQV